MRKVSDTHARGCDNPAMRSPIVAALLLALLAACGDEPTPPAAAAARRRAPRARRRTPSTTRTPRRAAALATAAVETLAEDPVLGLLLAREALRTADGLRGPRGRPPRARGRAGRRALPRPPRLHPRRRVVSRRRPRAHDLARLRRAALEPAGRADRGARAVTAATVLGGTFSPDGERVLTWSVDHTARLWDREGNAAPRPGRPHGGADHGRVRTGRRARPHRVARRYGALWGPEGAS